MAPLESTSNMGIKAEANGATIEAPVASPAAPPASGVTSSPPVTAVTAAADGVNTTVASITSNADAGGNQSKATDELVPNTATATSSIHQESPLELAATLPVTTSMSTPACKELTTDDVKAALAVLEEQKLLNHEILTQMAQHEATDAEAVGEAGDEAPKKKRKPRKKKPTPRLKKTTTATKEGEEKVPVAGETVKEKKKDVVYKIEDNQLVLVQPDGATKPTLKQGKKRRKKRPTPDAKMEKTTGLENNQVAEGVATGIIPIGQIADSDAAKKKRRKRRPKPEPDDGEGKQPNSSPREPGKRKRKKKPTPHQQGSKESGLASITEHPDKQEESESVSLLNNINRDGHDADCGTDNSRPSQKERSIIQTREAPQALLSSLSQEKSLPEMDALLRVQDSFDVDVADCSKAAVPLKRTRRFDRSKFILVALTTLAILVILAVVYIFAFGWNTSKDNMVQYYDIPGLPEETLQVIKSDSSSPQRRAYAWLYQDPARDEYPDWRLLQRFVVATMVYSFRESSGDVSLSEMFPDGNDPFLDYEQSECEWGSNKDSLEPPSCDDMGRMVNLDVSSASGVLDNLVTDLPEEISLLSDLESLAMSKNGIVLSWDDLLPLFWLPNLKRLDVSENFLTGVVHFPSELSTLQQMTQLNLAKNRLSGTMSSSIDTLRSLEQLDLSNNQFSNMPSELGSLKELQHLSLAVNLLTGIPSSLGSLANLEYIDLSSNFIAGPAVFGEDWSSLRILRYGSNFFSGSLPSSIGLYTSLVELDVSGTELVGRLNSEMGRLTKLETLRLSTNFLEGDIPSEWSAMTSLNFFEVFGNEIAGELPSGFCGVETMVVDCEKVQCRDCSCDCYLRR